jgi:rubrerythrin
MSFQFSVYQIAELAVEVEEASTNFYKRLALTTDDPAIKDTFNLLSQQESGHRNVFAQMTRDLKGRNEEFEYVIDLYGMMKYSLDKLKNKAFSATVTLRTQDIIEALDVAVKAEETSVSVYTQLRNTVSAQFHETLDRILQVEQYHCKWVADLRNKISGLS